MSLSRPNAMVTIDGQALSAAEAGLVWLEVDVSVSGAHDAARFGLWPDSKFADSEPGAALTIALGEKDDETDVLTGEVTVPHAMPDASVLEGCSATIALSREYKSQTYLDQSVGDIVNDLAGSISIDEVDASLQLAVYYADNRRSVWAHLQMLAGLAQADLGSSPDGGLRFVPPTGGLPLRLRYGAELLHWKIGAAAEPPVAALSAHGAGSEAGANKWHWLRHDPVGAGGDPTRVIGGLATRDAAELAGTALEERAGRATRRGSVGIVGNPSIRPGDVVELADLPGNDPGALRVLRVQHRFHAREGFTTRLTVEGSGGGGLGL